MSKLILISLLIFVASKNLAIEYGEEVPFDKNNNKFQFDSGNSDAVFIYVLFESSDKLYFKMTNSAGSSLTADIESPGDKFISSLSKGYTYTIELRYYNPNSDAKGLIWVNPSNNEIKVNLTKKYEWKFDYAKISGAETKLIYAIDNSEKKVTFNFKYNSKMKLYDGSTVQNPFEVCHGTDCKSSLSTYDFEEGESYKIYVKVILDKSGFLKKYILPSFYFCDKANDNFSFSLRFNILTIFLLLLFIF